MVQGFVERESRERTDETASRYTFQNFVVGRSNQMAHAAALSVAERPGEHYNPLFIYSEPGLGKTHLLLAIAREVVNRAEQVVYVTGEQFYDNFQDRGFCQNLTTGRYLLVDNIQFVVGEEAQKKLAGIFDILKRGNQQIVVTSDRRYQNIRLLDPRLKSHFEEGLEVEIDLPERQLLVAILGEKAKERGLDLTPDIFDLIVKRTVGGIRQMEGYLNRVIAFAEAYRRPITFEMAVEALDEIRARRLQAQVGDIIPVVAKMMDITEEQIRGPKRTKGIVLARHVAMWLMREETSLSLADIGDECGGRNHSTVVHACGRIEEELKINLRFARQVAQIREELYRIDRG